MLDSIKIVQAIANQNIPNYCIDHFFSGEFEARYDNVVINYEENGYQRNLSFGNVVIKTKLSTSVCTTEGNIHTSLSVIMKSNNRVVFDNRLNRPKYVAALAKVFKQISNSYQAQDTNRNLKLWEIVDKF